MSIVSDVPDGGKPENDTTVAAALAEFVGRRHLTEMRALDGGEGFLASGFFLGADLQDLARAAAAANAEGQVYFIINPIKPTVPGKYRTAPLRVRRRGKDGKGGPSTKDADVLYRKWLFIDIDAIKGDKKGSATAAEKAACLEVAHRVRDFLRGLGWPEPYLIDSGNGYYLAYRISLTNTEANKHLLKAVLYALAGLFNGPGGEVDTSVFSAGQLMKVPGTWAKKGADTPERPHRQSGILERPAKVRPVTRAQLGELAAMYEEAERAGKKPADAPPAGDRTRPGDDFNHRHTPGELLAADGWKKSHTTGAGVEHWTGPHKDAGTSATVGHVKSWDGRPLIYVFTTSVPPLQARRSYDPFGYRTATRHGGDFAAAAAALAAEGYGGDAAGGRTTTTRTGAKPNRIGPTWRTSPTSGSRTGRAGERSACPSRPSLPNC